MRLSCTWRLDAAFVAVVLDIRSAVMGLGLGLFLDLGDSRVESAKSRGTELHRTRCV
jgi:hypothetical protein